LIAFNAATLRLGGKTIVENLDLDVRQFLFIVGASGCGKTTALRLAACLYRPAQPRREVAIMFQDYGKALLADCMRKHLARWGPAGTRAARSHRGITPPATLCSQL